MGKDYKYNFDKKIKSKKSFTLKMWMPLAKLIVNTCFNNVKYYGEENIPKEGSFILAPNHISNYDPILIGVNGIRDMHFMCKIEIFRKWYLRPILLYFNGFPVDRGSSDREALKYSIRVLKEGNVLCLFPEGTRSKTFEKPKDGKPGIAIIAREAKTDVLPVSIRKFKIDDKHTDIIVRYGKLIKHEEFEFSEKRTSKDLKRATDKIMERIGELWEMDSAK